MKIPQKIKIGGHYFEVIKSKELMTESGRHGDCIFNTNKIEINDNAKPDIMGAVLLHEILEALDYMYELGLEHNKIKTLEVGLYQVLKDNKFKFYDD